MQYIIYIYIYSTDDLMITSSVSSNSISLFPEIVFQLALSNDMHCSTGGKTLIVITTRNIFCKFILTINLMLYTLKNVTIKKLSVCFKSPLDVKLAHSPSMLRKQAEKHPLSLTLYLIFKYAYVFQSNTYSISKYSTSSNLKSLIKDMHKYSTNQFPFKIINIKEFNHFSISPCLQYPKAFFLTLGKTYCSTMSPKFTTS